MTEAIQVDVAAVASIEAVPKILEAVCHMTGMGFAAVARVTGERWVACAVQDTIAFGLQPGGELKVETTICREVRQSREAVIINHISDDAAYCGHPTPAMYGFESYISVPIILPDGVFFGTLCAIDPLPAQLDTPAIIGTFKLFAELIALHLSATDQLTATETRLLDERRTSALREQFIAVLGHDLRSPLAAISSGMHLLERTPLDEKAARVVGLVQKSIARMSGLIDDILDFARGRLGGGLILEPTDQQLEPVLTQIIAELQTSWPDRDVEVDFNLPAPVTCDRCRIGQLLSNLLDNALKHGAPDMPIRVSASTNVVTFELAVTNFGEPIPPPVLTRLFEPFARGSTNRRQHGLGLGLFICAEIARAHGGLLDVTSSPEGTCFTFRMPLIDGPAGALL